MSLHILSHPWEVQEVEDGILVKITPQDLDVQTIAILTDELFELAQESGQRTLYLDFREVDLVPSILIGKLFALDRNLREVEGCLVLCNLNPVLTELLQVERWLGDGTPA